MSPILVLGFGLMLVSFALTPLCEADPLTVLEGLEVVTTRGYDVRIAETRYESAVLSENLARSNMRPHVNAYADYTWLENKPEALFAGGSSPLSDDHFARYGINIRQTITDFGRTNAGVDSARASALAQAGFVSQARNGLALEFIQAYISLLRAERTLDVAHQEVKRFKAHAGDARNLYDAGEVTRSDVLAAEVALSDALQREITARDGRELAVSSVNYLVLKPLADPIQTVEFPYPLADEPDMSALLSAAETSRAEIIILDRRITATRAKLRMRESDSLPVVYVGGGYSFEENPYRVHEDNWSAVVGLTWDLYTGGARTAEQAQIERELSAELTERERLLVRIRLEIREGILNLNGASERIHVAEKALTQAEEHLRLQNARYQEGEASETEVTDAVTNLSKAQNNLWGAEYDRQRAEAQLLFAAGLDIRDAYRAASSNGMTFKPETDHQENYNE